MIFGIQYEAKLKFCESYKVFLFVTEHTFTNH